MWYKSSNSNNVKPSAIDTTSSKSCVYLRKDFTLIPAKTEEEGQTTPEHWEYMERKMSFSEYASYVEQKSQIDYIALMTDVDLPTA